MIRESLFFCCFSFLLICSSLPSFQEEQIRYLPLGDSYTICTGASEQQSWPLLLTAGLNEAGVPCRLTKNPARNGYSSADLIREELPLVKELKPTFVTLLIGVNDWVRGVPQDTFALHLTYILNTLQKQLPDKGKIILLTIPDFGVTPTGKLYARGRDISKGIESFNDVIRREAVERGLPVVELFALSQHMGEDASLVSSDGLHPSAAEYALWYQRLLPVARNLLK